jgi:hypothetical protein
VSGGRQKSKKKSLAWLAGKALLSQQTFEQAQDLLHACRAAHRTHTESSSPTVVIALATGKELRHETNKHTHTQNTAANFNEPATTCSASERGSRGEGCRSPHVRFSTDIRRTPLCPLGASGSAPSSEQSMCISVIADECRCCCC